MLAQPRARSSPRTPARRLRDRTSRERVAERGLEQTCRLVFLRPCRGQRPRHVVGRATRDQPAASAVIEQEPAAGRLARRHDRNADRHRFHDRTAEGFLEGWMVGEGRRRPRWWRARPDAGPVRRTGRHGRGLERVPTALSRRRRRGRGRGRAARPKHRWRRHCAMATIAPRTFLKATSLATVTTMGPPDSLRPRERRLARSPSTRFGIRRTRRLLRRLT